MIFSDIRVGMLYRLVIVQITRNTEPRVNPFNWSLQGQTGMKHLQSCDTVKSLKQLPITS